MCKRDQHYDHAFIRRLEHLPTLSPFFRPPQRRFLLGWICPPCWLAAAAAYPCLIRRDGALITRCEGLQYAKGHHGRCAKGHHWSVCAQSVCPNPRPAAGLWHQQLLPDHLPRWLN